MVIKNQHQAAETTDEGHGSRHDTRTMPQRAAPRTSARQASAPTSAGSNITRNNSTSTNVGVNVTVNGTTTMGTPTGRATRSYTRAIALIKAARAPRVPAASVARVHEFIPDANNDAEGSSTRAYIHRVLQDHVLDGLRHLALNQPENPLRWLALHLRHRSEMVEGPWEEDRSMTAEGQDDVKTMSMMELRGRRKEKK